MPDLRCVVSQAGALRRRPLKLAAFVLSTIWEYTRVLTGREVQDVFVADDRAPGWRELADHLNQFVSALGSKMPGAANRAGNRDRSLLRRALGRPTSSGHNIMFVCQGNICRSPLAAGLLQRELGDNIGNIRVHSSGNLPRMGAVSPAAAITAAKALGVDLQSHRSQHFSRTAAEQASVFVIFDEINRRWIKERYPELKAPVVMLGSFSSHISSNRAIADPDGGDLAKFESVYAEIADAVLGLAKEIRRAGNV
jgi:protein-tyrosine phosphatase